jgi:hypothetical protein
MDRRSTCSIAAAMLSFRRNQIVVSPGRFELAKGHHLP